MNKKSMKKTIAAVFFTLLAVSLANCEYMPDMKYSPAVDAQEIDLLGNRVGNFLPPEGSVHYGSDYSPELPGKAAALEQANDLPVPEKINTAAGAEQFRIYCSHCHGAEGAGGGKVPFPGAGPINFTVKTLPQVYYYITSGGAIMPAHGSQISEENRWAIAWYVKNKIQKQ